MLRSNVPASRPRTFWRIWSRVELAGREFHRLSVRGEQQARVTIQLVAGETELPPSFVVGCRGEGGGIGPSPPEDAAHPRQQLSQLERLGDIVVGADLQSGDPVDQVVLSAQHDDAALAFPAQAGGQRQAVLSGQLDVENDEVRRPGLEDPLHGRAVAGLADLEAFGAQIIADHFPDLRVVVHDQDVLAGVRDAAAWLSRFWWHRRRAAHHALV
jgi:hypothetical protein